MRHPTTLPSTVRRTAAVLLAVLAFALLDAAPASAADAVAPRIHHVFPEDGAVLATPPDYVQVMFDVDLVPGRVGLGAMPDTTGRMVDLPTPAVIEGPVVEQSLPPLPPGHYTVAVRLLAPDGREFGSTFGFAVDPAAAPAARAADGAAPTGPASWLVPAIAVALVVPAVTLVVLRRRRPAPGGGPGARGRAGGRTPT